MLRYALDKLGWNEFEGLIQALLKAEIGMGVEAWGGSKDWGRDAYFAGQLQYPSKKMTRGPFFFQCKFISDANAAGAKPTSRILAAVDKECQELEKLFLLHKCGKRSRARRTLAAPRYYTFVTNAVVSPLTRREIKKRLGKSLPASFVSIQDGRDICASLDNNPRIVRAFPQLFSLRDLDELLRGWVNADILARSESALAEAHELSRVYVPTKAYEKTIMVLQKHHFAILEGPPEMGKTAIGRMIALAQIAQSWEAIECRYPEDFLRQYRAEVKQVFVGDDFFGRTEYDPARVLSWQQELSGILRRLDAHHWLILTSRAHLLNMGKQDLDLGSEGSRFPSLGEVLVDAGALTQSEKARILYRHSKWGVSDLSTKQLLRQEAQNIIANTYYTPERIRRLIVEWLPTEITPNIATLGREDLRRLIQRNLQDPTRGMSMSFRKLPSAHKWLLFAVVEQESEYWYSGETLVERYRQICPENEFQPFEKVVGELSEAFVRRLSGALGPKITWVHPSCRDLVIDEFAQNDQLRKHYLRNCSIEGIKLATSFGGGERGRREVPLIKDQEDWELLAQRAVDLFGDKHEILSVLLQNFKVVRQNPELNKFIPFFEATLFEKLFPCIYSLSEQGKLKWKVRLLKDFYEARKMCTLYFPTVNPSVLWEDVGRRACESLKGDFVIYQSHYWPGQFVDLVELLKENDPGFLKRLPVAQHFDEVLGEFLRRGEHESGSHYSLDGDSVEQIGEVEGGLAAVSDVYVRLADLSEAADNRTELARMADEFERQSDEAANERNRLSMRLEEEEVDISMLDERGRSSTYTVNFGSSSNPDWIDVAKLFEDL